MSPIEDKVFLDLAASSHDFRTVGIGANALALSIFGEANRWGRMPYTVYRSDWTLHNSMLDHDVVHQRTYRYGADAVIPSLVSNQES